MDQKTLLELEFCTWLRNTTNGTMSNVVCIFAIAVIFGTHHPHINQILSHVPQYFINYTNTETYVKDFLAECSCNLIDYRASQIAKNGLVLQFYFLKPELKEDTLEPYTQTILRNSIPFTPSWK